MPTISPSPGAGAGATAAIQADSSGLRGRLRVVTGTAPAAGAIALVTLDVQLIADMDAWTAAQGFQNVVLSVAGDILLTPWTAPPVGCAFPVLAQLNGGLLTGFVIGSTAALQAAKEYRFGWRVFT